MPRSRSRLENRSSWNQRLERWTRSARSGGRSCARGSAPSSGTKVLGALMSPSYFGHLVLEDQVVPEGVPGELAAEPVVLVQVGALVREHQVRRESAFSSSKKSLIRCALVREEAVGEVAHDHLTARRRPRAWPRRSRAPPRRARPRRSARPSGPRDRLLLDQLEERAAAADLDVVGMRADREDAPGGVPAGRCDSGSIIRRRRTPPGRRGDAVGRPRAATEPAPLSCRVSRHCLSFSVSIGAQKPSWRWASSSPRGEQALERLLHHVLAGPRSGRGTRCAGRSSRR